MTKRQQKKRSGCLPFIFVLLILCVAGYLFWRTDFAQKRFVYTWPYAKEIHQYSAQYRVDPFLAVAVIKNESGFKPDAESKTGALGLMQIMPETGAWIAKSTDFPNFKAKMLNLPELNIKFGCWYLKELEEEFHSNEILMLAAYNAGRGVVKDWMEEYGWGFDFSDISQIPFDDTRNYVRKVLNDRESYERLYKNSFKNI
ncbi:MAG: lytic transglycosylase domain-containing protein [Acidaminococcus sp.]|nr:lytic transglycosylase domain-containing protein [Acidaminococcus sp.]MCI2099579.1 lytic transglycosylase domain-containing protein [Acidaminococcus sp.]MCI2115747.1 lytic transglycosylase domain-containing protein [Acidaminococcus sp.]